MKYLFINFSTFIKSNQYKYVRCGGLYQVCDNTNFSELTIHCDVCAKPLAYYPDKDTVEKALKEMKAEWRPQPQPDGITEVITLGATDILFEMDNDDDAKLYFELHADALAASDGNIPRFRD